MPKKLTVTPEIQNEARKELARRVFWEYCKRRYPELYKEDRPFLKELCNRIQEFIEQNEKRFLVINIPPRHMKSLTATNLVEWLFGLNTKLKVMTGSYNEMLSTTFAGKVRDSIDQRPSRGVEVYADLFPNTRIQAGKSSKSLWALEGSAQDNYLATSPTGTSTGFGANIILIDDIIKNAKEAFNQMILQDHINWFTDTMMSRTEGDDWKVIAIMTRWAKGDLAGEIIERYGDLVEVIQFKAVQEDGSMLCEDILSKTDYEIKTQEMSPEIVEANYNQQPIDVQGRLYDDFMTWETLPEAAADAKVWNYTDTADKGTDWLCSVSYVVVNDEVYVLDVVMSDGAMEMTEPLVAEMLDRTGTNEAEVESNNGGRGFGRNIERLLKEIGNLRCIITDKHQSANKEARILSSSAWVQRHVYMPLNWKSKYREFYKQLSAYQRKGKNEHDDAPDVLAGIYERVANTKEIEYGWKVS
jgi:predicted phage terminase large subunit-like protein